MAEPLARALAARDYTTPTPIQVQAMPPQIANRDLIALAETGSGKTAAFVLPILNAMAKTEMVLQPRMVGALILAPTRELAIQIDAEVAALSRFMDIRRAVVLGGVSKGPQINALKRGVHVLVATPGRLLDHVNCRNADLRSTMTLVIDEADRMFDMGFIRDIRKIVGLLPRQRRTALLSATMPPEIRTLANELLTDPVRVDLSTKTLVVDRITQKVMMVRTPEKQSRLHTILADEACQRVIVFTRTKRGADRVADRLAMAGIGAAAMHGNKAQNARQRALNDFSAGHIRVLVATDIAARGIDVSNVSHVVNFEMPLDAETYVHRIGRTARKGESGIAISLCDPSERGQLRDIERLTKLPIQIIGDIGGEPVAMPDRKPAKEQHGQPRRDARRSDNRSQERRNPQPRDGRPTKRDYHAATEPVPQTGATHRKLVAARPAWTPVPHSPTDAKTADTRRPHQGGDRSERRAPKPEHGHRENTGLRAEGDRRPRPEGERGEGRPARSREQSGPRTEGRAEGGRDHDRRPHHGKPERDSRHPSHGRDHKTYDGHRTERPRHTAAEGQGPRPEGARTGRPRFEGPREGRTAQDSGKPNHHGKPRHEAGPQGERKAGPASGGRNAGNAGGGNAGGRANWDGQKPPKFLKQRREGGDVRSTGRPRSEPAA